MTSSLAIRRGREADLDDDLAGRPPREIVPGLPGPALDHAPARPRT